MKRTLLLLLLIIFISFGTQPDACVGRILNIGIVDSINENLLAELVSVLINERTGTTVNVKVFDSRTEIYDAVKKEKIGIVIENTGHAMSMLNIPAAGSMEAAYDISKKEFRKKLNLIWLKPFGLLPADSGKGQLYYAAVITEDVLINFPALPRVINKLKNISTDRRFGKVIRSAGSGKKIKRVARDFLKKKKLI